MDADPHQIVAVSGLVRDTRGRVLLVRTPRRGWEPPGGQVEAGEDLPTALVREIMEESNCAARVGRLIGVYSNLAGATPILVLTFLCDHLSGEPRAGHECTDAGWFTPDEARRRVEHPAVAARLTDALADVPGVIYRAYRSERAAVGSHGSAPRWNYHVLSERRC